MKKFFSDMKKNSGLKNRSPWSRRGLQFESLEDRTLLTAVPNGWGLDQIDGQVGADSSSTVILNVSSSEAETVLGIQFSAKDISSLNPGAITVFSYDPETGTETDVTESVAVFGAETNRDDSNDSVIFIKVAAGEYHLKVAAENETVGEFTCAVFYPGDRSGDGTIDESELKALTGRVTAITVHNRGIYSQATVRLYQSLYGIDITKSAEALYDIECDLNLDGKLNADDVNIAKINVGQTVYVALSVSETPEVPVITPALYSFTDPLVEDATDPVSVKITEDVTVTCDAGTVTSFTVSDLASMTPTFSLTNAAGETYAEREALIEYWGITETEYNTLLNDVAAMATVSDGTFTFQNVAGTFDRLAEGETLELTFTYNIVSFVVDEKTYETATDGTVRLSISGVNDAPSGEANHTATVHLSSGNITFDDGKTALNVLDGVVDPEGETLTVTQGEIDAGDFSVSADAVKIASNGEVVIDIEKLKEELTALEEDAIASVTAYFTISDPHDASLSGQLALTITLTNHAPTGETAHVGTLDLNTGMVTFDSETGDFDLLSGVTDLDNDDLTVTADTMTPDEGFTLTQGGIVVNADGTVTFNAETLASDFGSLKRGETADVVIAYTISDGNGGTLAGTATLTISGKNHAPAGTAVHTGTVDLSAGTIVYDDNQTTLNVLTGVTDFDGDTVTALLGTIDAGDYTVSSGAVLISATGEVTLNTEIFASDFTGLAGSATANVTVHYTLSDGDGGSLDGTLTLTVHGKNDTPTGETSHTGTVRLDTGVVTFDEGQITLNVLDGVTDPEGETLTVTQGTIDAGDYTVTSEAVAVSSTGEVTVNITKLTEELAAAETGENVAVTVNFTISDPGGQTLAGTIVLTVVNDNHAPSGETSHTGTIDLETQTAAYDDGQTALNVLAGVTDVDGDPLTVTLVSVTPAESGYTVSDGAFTIASDGTVACDTALLASDFDALKFGETTTVTVNFSISDGNGGTLVGTVTLTISGKNHAPAGLTTHVGTVVLETESVDFDGEGASLNVLSGMTDADDDAMMADLKSVDSGDLTISAGAFLISESGDVTVDVSILKTDLADLGMGESAVITLHFSVSDTHGAQTDGTITVTVTGNNQSPIGVADHTATVNLEAGTVSFDSDPAKTALNVLTGVSDPDGEALTVIQGEIDAGGVTLSEGAVAVEADGDVLVDLAKLTTDFASLAANASATVTLNFTVRDAQGLTVGGKVLFTVTGQNDAPVENSPLTGTFDLTTGVLLFNSGESDPDLLFGMSDPDGDSMTAALNGVTAPEGYEVSSGAITAITDDAGILRLLINREILADVFDLLPLGQEAVITIAVSVTDGNGESVSRSVALTVIGAYESVFMAKDFTVSASLSEAVDHYDIDLTAVSYAEPESADLDSTKIYVKDQTGEFILLSTSNGVTATLASGAQVNFSAEGKLRYTFAETEKTSAAETGSFEFKVVDTDGTVSDNSANGSVILTIAQTVSWETDIADQTGRVNETISIKIADYVSGEFDAENVTVRFTDLDGNALTLDDIDILESATFDAASGAFVFTMLTEDNYSASLDFSAVKATITVNSDAGTESVTSNAFELALTTVKVSLAAVTSEFGGKEVTELRTGAAQFGTFYYVSGDNVPTTDYDALADVTGEYYLEIWVQDYAGLYSDNQKFISSIQVEFDYDASAVESVQLEDLYAGKTALDSYLYYNSENELKSIQVCWMFADTLDWSRMEPITNGQNAYLLARLTVTIPATKTASDLNVTLSGVSTPESPFIEGYYYVRTGDSVSVSDSSIETVNVVFPTPQATDALLPFSLRRYDVSPTAPETFVSAKIRDAGDQFFEDWILAEETPTDDDLFGGLETTLTVNEERELIDVYFSGCFDF